MRDQPAGEKNNRYPSQNDEPQAQKNAKVFSVRSGFGCRTVVGSQKPISLDVTDGPTDTFRSVET